MRTANRGKVLEAMIDHSNAVYAHHGVLHIRKIDAKVKTIRDHTGEISKVFYAEKSGLDYVGVLGGGRFITFDAKECASKTSFPLSNIKPHQIDEMEVVIKKGGIAFMLVYFETLKEAYILTLDMIQSAAQSGKKSISIKEFRESAIPVESNKTIILDYVAACYKLIPF
jgi:recombination protein U